MKVLVACEFSGIVRDAFIRAGHTAMSCDLLPSESDYGSHYRGDVLDLLRLGNPYDLMIAFPPCTYTANSGVRWLHEIPGRWKLMYQAVEFFNELLTAPIEKICIESPILHGHATKLIPGTYDQIIQPWQYGHPETKATCLRLKNLPALEPTNIVEGREARIHRMSPGPDRGKERSRFYVGIAEAMADQWGEK